MTINSCTHLYDYSFIHYSNNLYDYYSFIDYSTHLYTIHSFFTPLIPTTIHSFITTYMYSPLRTLYSWFVVYFQRIMFHLNTSNNRYNYPLLIHNQTHYTTPLHYYLTLFIHNQTHYTTPFHYYLTLLIHNQTHYSIIFHFYLTLFILEVVK